MADVTEHEPGIWFGLDEDEYRADPALSQSGVRELLVSPLDFWTRYLDPEREEETNSAMTFGKAFDCRIFEPERYVKTYAAIPRKEDFPDAIDGAEALREECERLGVKKSGKIADMCERILDADPRAQLWPVIKETFEEANEGKTFLKYDDVRAIERNAGIVLANPHAAKAVTGGQAQVSIFWFDSETGVRMKARLDYLKTQAVVDLKTFSNSLRKPVDTAIAMSIANERYDVQAYAYLHAVEQAKAMLRKMKSQAVHGEAPDNEWLVSLAACPQHTFYFLFVQSGKVPNVRVREFRQHEKPGTGGTTNLYWQSGEAGYRHGLRAFKQYMDEIGPDEPWIVAEPPTALVDTELPMWLFN